MKAKNSQSIETRNFGGWLDKKYFYYCWALSCLQLCKYYSNVDLVTDEFGKAIFIDLMELPYTSYSTELENISSTNTDLWAQGKLYTYLQQDQPFIHIDGDVLIWDKLDETIINSNLVAQNPENNVDFYFKIWDDIQKTFSYIPDYMNDTFEKYGIVSCNAGVFGGTDIAFIKDFANEALKFLKVNEDSFSKIDAGMSVLIYEQFLFSSFAKKQNKEVSYLLGEAATFDFEGVPNRTKFIHPYGYLKRQRYTCMFIENMLEDTYPDHYKRINGLLKSKII